MTLLTNNGFDFFFKNYKVLYVFFSGFFPDEKGFPVFEFKNLMSKSDSSCLFIRDVYKCWYQLGIDGFGKSLEDSINFLKEFIKPYNNVVFVGNSMGGYASLLFGILIKPTHIVAISPQTYLYNDDTLNDQRWEMYFERARKYNKKVSFLNLGTLVENSNCKAVVYYSFNDYWDKKHVDLLSNSNILTIPCYGASHRDLIGKLNSKNFLTKIIFNNLNQENSHLSMFPKGRIIF